jgi:DNA polymerase III alpha subunit
MNINKYGSIFLNSDELFESIYKGKLKDFKNIHLDQPVVDQFNYSKDLNKDNFDYISNYIDPNCSLEQFDTNLQDDWFMPEKYKPTSFNMVEYLVSLCKDETETNRVLDELALFAQYNMIELLCYLKYLVDTMREHNIVWGVGRGSSVASYCLYLLGIHKINSIKYELDIKEFLK